MPFSDDAEEKLTGWGVFGALLTDVVLHPEGFSVVARATGYELWLSFWFLEAERRYRAWRSTWDTTEEEDYAAGIST